MREENELNCDIIIPIWNELKRTQRCLQSILKNTSSPYRLLLIDNGSKTPTAEYLKKFAQDSPQSLLIRNPQNLGYVKAINQGLRATISPFICLLNNDTIVFPGWLDKMLRAAESDPQIGVVNPGPYQLEYKKPWWFSWESFAKKVGAREKDKRQELSMASGFCMLIKRPVFERVGFWNEDYGLGYYEDSEFSRRAIQAGFTCVHARDAIVYHEEKISFRKFKKTKRLAQLNRERFEGTFGKSERIAFFMKTPDPGMRERVEKEALRLARANHRSWIFTDRTDWDFKSNHAAIRAHHWPAPLFSLLCAFHLWKKKKKYDQIYSNAPRLLKFNGKFKIKPL